MSWNGGIAAKEDACARKRAETLDAKWGNEAKGKQNSEAPNVRNYDEYPPDLLSERTSIPETSQFRPGFLIFAVAGMERVRLALICGPFRDRGAIIVAEQWGHFGQLLHTDEYCHSQCRLEWRIV
jgi:hypothetical protein